MLINWFDLHETKNSTGNLQMGINKATKVKISRISWHSLIVKKGKLSFIYAINQVPFSCYRNYNLGTNYSQIVKIFVSGDPAHFPIL